MMITPPDIMIYGLIFASAFMAMQFAIGAGRQGARKIKLANIRMQVLAKHDTQSEALNALLKSRGLGETGHLAKLMGWLNVLVIHSGLRIGAYGVYMIMSACAFVFAVGSYIVLRNLPYAVLGFVAGFSFPVLVLILITKRRRKKATIQLPEALDVVVRSLRAGHPVPVAVELVAREMPDPIGSEFGIASDEITYGTALGKAIQRMAERIGHADFDMFAATIRLQEKTGGNLTELLSNNATMVRLRQKMRLKIKAASSEGRMSALILNVVPILLFFGVNFMSPDFYGDVMDEPIVKKVFTGIVIWMIIGNLIIRKMINFKI